MAITDQQMRNDDIGAIFGRTTVTKKVLEEIQRQGEEGIESKIREGYMPLEDEERTENALEGLQEAYDNIMDLLKMYCDLKPQYYNIITLWIIGTYFHKEFPSFAYLYFNAMRGSGNSRTMGLVTTLAHKGQMLNSLTEAVLFRTEGCLGIDEFEGMERKGGEALRELLNSGYKKGTKVKRMRKKKTMEGEELVVEEFDVYRPIVMANIAGIENVLEDRCIPIILEKSNNPRIINLVEMFDTDPKAIKAKEILNSLVKGDTSSVVSVNVVTPGNIYKEWNDYIISSNIHGINNTNNINNNNNTNNTNNNILFEIIKNSGIYGRDLEICIPILMISNLFGRQTLEETTLTLQKIMSDKQDDNFTENKDVMLIDYVSQLPDSRYYKKMNVVVQEFKEFIQMSDEWINNKWMGRALKRLGLALDKRRVSSGVEVTLDILKAQDKIKMFKVKE